MTTPRVAFFTDSFHEVNGVARTSREFARFARQQQLPFFSVHTGPTSRHFVDGSLETYELQHSRYVMRLETDLSFDWLVIRHRAPILQALKKFRPDLIHVTGPGHCGLLGAMLAWHLNIPVVASWHTNVHEFGGRRLNKLLRFLPGPIRRLASRCAEYIALAIILWFYKCAELLFAPNPELVNMLHAETGLPTYLMKRGIDTDLFSPRQRNRPNDEFVIGYVGRLSSEKNVRLLVDLEQRLLAQGVHNYRFLVVGDGGDRQWLASHLQKRDMPGILLGAELATAYANMDVFVFPSETDTFGNVVLEAMSSGLPTIVSSGGGPKYIIRNGIDGFEAADAEAFAQAVLALYRDSALRRRMSDNARAGAAQFSWNAVFSSVYSHYSEALGLPVTTPAIAATKKPVLIRSAAS